MQYLYYIIYIILYLYDALYYCRIQCYVFINYFHFKVVLITFFSDKRESRLVCPKNCGRSYKNKCSIDRHLKFKCGVQPKFKCFVCSRTFTDKHSMKRHMILVHKYIIWWILNNYYIIYLQRNVTNVYTFILVNYYNFKF